MQPSERPRARAATVVTAAMGLTALFPATAAAAPPGNDSFAGAAPLTSVPAVGEVALAEATAEPGEPDPSCGSYSAAPSAWFAFTAPRTESITLARTSFEWDTVLAVYTGDSLGGLTEVFCRTYDRRILNVTAGQTYRIQVSNWRPDTQTTRIELGLAPTLKTDLYTSVFDPSTLDTITFSQYAYDTVGEVITSVEWDFGDGTTGSGTPGTHRYPADGDYVARVNITSADGRTATATRAVTVRTHDVRIAGFTTPAAGRVNQTKPIEVKVANERLPENATVVLYRSTPGGFEEIARATQYVPARPNRTVAFPFNYTFTPEDATFGKVTFRAEVTLPQGARDVRLVDNEVIASATTVRPGTDEVS
ncbi:PKD domain-containing protein [Actinophytocola oryzae]|uniref:PKD domain-containing protein n=1 Tax=Actinophytocola oryzae TaxID=502181 RepID=A0A4R7V2K8_9PSEU|nr:PKD domain-containing protein [Actinophytocola oryzae]TDV43080.1 PKD domain-containing protein [Actinophytocola oryzae]